MPKFLNRNFYITLAVTVFFIIIIIITSRIIKINSSINSLFPDDRHLRLSADIAAKSPNARKIMIYTEVNDEENLLSSIDTVKKTIKESGIKFSNAIPGTEDILSLLEFAENNSLLLYPYESNVNPFTDSQIRSRLENKSLYLSSMPFASSGSSFLYDPLMFAPELLKGIQESGGGKYTPKYGGVISDDKKSFIQILRTDFGNEDYGKIKELKNLDAKLKKASKAGGFNSFVFCSHLYFLESKTKITFDITIIFILTAVFVILIFYFFFKKIYIIIYAFMPIIGGYALTMLIISFVKPLYGGISLAFGATIIGITIDYVIHFITKRNYYKTLRETRKKIGLSLLMALLTTLASFIFLVFSKIEALFEIALFGFISITAVYLISWFVLHPLLPLNEGIKNKIAFRIPLINSRVMFIIWIVITAFTLIFVPLIKFEDNIMNLDMNHKELEKRKKIIIEKFSESNDNIFLIFTGSSRDEILEKSLNASKIVSAKSKENSFMTPAVFMPSRKIIDKRKEFIKNNFDKKVFIKNLASSDFTIDSFDPWLDNVKNADSLNITALPTFFEKEYNSMFIEVHGREYLLIHIYKRSKAEEIKKILTADNIDFETADIIEDSKKGMIDFEKKSLILLSFSILLIIIIIAVLFKNILFGFLGSLPGITGLLACIATSYFTNNGFNLMHFVSCVLIMGIGVDYGIFIITSYKNKLSEEEFYLTAQSVLVCSLTTIAGFGVLAVSSNYSIFSIGSSMFTGIVSSAFTTFYAIPFILNRITKHRFNEGKK